MTYDNNPFELGLDRLVNLDIDADFIGKNTLMLARKTRSTCLWPGTRIHSVRAIRSKDELKPERVVARGALVATKRPEITG